MTGSRVLVVDDNRTIAQTVATLIRLLGHYCTCADDGPTAVAMAEDYRPDVILLDLRMPEMNGFDVIRALRNAGCQAKIVAMTGFGLSSFEEKAEEAGFDAL